MHLAWLALVSDETAQQLGISDLSIAFLICWALATIPTVFAIWLGRDRPRPSSSEFSSPRDHEHSH